MGIKHIFEKYIKRLICDHEWHDVEYFIYPGHKMKSYLTIYCPKCKATKIVTEKKWLKMLIDKKVVIAKPGDKLVIRVNPNLNLNSEEYYFDTTRNVFIYRPYPEDKADRINRIDKKYAKRNFKLKI